MLDKNLDLSSIKGSVVVIPAAGKGSRFDNDSVKQYQMINDVAVLEITLKTFLSNNSIAIVVLVISPDDEEYQDLPSIGDEKIIIIDGGEERQDSVSNALRFLYDNQLPDDTPLLVHDAVRPCLSLCDLEQLFTAYSNKKGCYFLAEKMANSIKKLDQDNHVKEGVDRQDLVHALTPQMAPFIVLKHAYSATNVAGLKITDEVGALTNSDIEVTAILAKDLNPKMTFKRDLELAKHLIEQAKK